MALRSVGWFISCEGAPLSTPSGPAVVRMVALGAALVLLLTPVPAMADSSPVDALSEAEIREALRVVEAAPQFVPGAYVPLVTLHEPPKAEMLAWTPRSAFRREALVEVLERAATGRPRSSWTY